MFQIIVNISEYYSQANKLENLFSITNWYRKPKAARVNKIDRTRLITKKLKLFLLSDLAESHLL